MLKSILKHNSSAFKHRFHRQASKVQMNSILLTDMLVNWWLFTPIHLFPSESQAQISFWLNVGALSTTNTILRLRRDSLTHKLPNMISILNVNDLSFKVKKINIQSWSISHKLYVVKGWMLSPSSPTPGSKKPLIIHSPLSKSQFMSTIKSWIQIQKHSNLNCIKKTNSVPGILEMMIRKFKGSSLRVARQSSSTITNTGESWDSPQSRKGSHFTRFTSRADHIQQLNITQNNSKKKHLAKELIRM